MSEQLTVKKMGNSLGVLFPMEMVKRNNLKPNQKVFIEVTKKADISDMFGTLKINMSGQKFKDMVRKGWD